MCINVSLQSYSYLNNSNAVLIVIVLLFPVGPQLECPTKLQVREGETFSCEVKGNPKPSVTWFRDGQAVLLPAHSSRRHAGTYTVLAVGDQVQKNFTVEVEVLTDSHNGGFSDSFSHCATI